jgi:hypothetical protein
MIESSSLGLSFQSKTISARGLLSFFKLSKSWGVMEKKAISDAEINAEQSSKNKNKITDQVKALESNIEVRRIKNCSGGSESIMLQN